MSKYKRNSNPNRRPVVGVIGASSAPPAVLEIATQVGGAVGKQGWHLLTGGGGGVMEAACNGFRNERATPAQAAIGILPTEDASFANDYVDIAVPTGMGYTRNAIIVRAAWGLIAVGGCSGTLSEIAFAWQADRPIVAMMDSGGWAEKLAGVAIDDRRSDAILAAQTADEAVEFLRSQIINK